MLKGHKENCQCMPCKSIRGKTKGKNAPNFKDGRCSKKYYCKDCKIKEITYVSALYGQGRCPSCANKGENSHFLGTHRFGEKAPMYNKHHNKKSKKRIGETSKQRWQNEEFRNKIIRAQREGMKIIPNIPEKKLGKLLGKDYKFVGDGNVIIGGFNPDFINCNGQKKIIEMFGDYWHRDSQEKDKRRLKEYSKLGYQTLIIWEHELKDKNRLKEKLIEFNNVPN